MQIQPLPTTPGAGHLVRCTCRQRLFLFHKQSMPFLTVNGITRYSVLEISNVLQYLARNYQPLFTALYCYGYVKIFYTQQLSLV